MMNKSLIIDKTTKLSALVDIEESIYGSKIIIGANSYIDAFVKIKFAGGRGNITIGENVTINSGCVLYSGNGIHIGNNVMIAANTVLAPTNHSVLKKNTLIRNQGFSVSRGGIVIEDDVWIGAACVVLDGAVIREGAVIGAMSLIRNEIDAYSINAGNPIKKIGCRS